MSFATETAPTNLTSTFPRLETAQHKPEGKDAFKLMFEIQVPIRSLRLLYKTYFLSEVGT